MAIPVLKPNQSWFTPNVDTVKRSIITIINFADTYTPTGTVTDSWDASVAQDGGAMCYVEDTTLTIAGNGSGKIMANEDSSRFLYTSDGSDSFSACTAINNFPLLDTSNVTTMNRMFRSCTMSTIDLSGLNTSKVTDMYQMFALCTNLVGQSIAHFDTSNVINMDFMFYDCDKWGNPDIANWDVSKVKSFDHFFARNSGVTNVDVSKWDVSSCENFNAMFNGTRIVELDLSNWNTRSAKILSQMFDGNTALKRVIGLENFYTANVYCFGQMFYGCTSLEEVDLSSFDTRNGDCYIPTSSNGSTSENTYHMFYNCRKLKKVTLGKNFTFLGNGTSTALEGVGVLPTPSSTYITGADGNWYASDGTAYAPADVPNLTYATYYASPTLAKEAGDSETYVSIRNLGLYDENIKGYIDSTHNWDTLLNKPTEIIGGDTLTWDGDTSGLESVDVMGDGSFFAYKLSNATPTVSELSTASGLLDSGNPYTVNTAVELEPNVILVSTSVGTSNTLVVLKDNTTSESLGVNITFPTKGIWIIPNGDALISSLTINGYTGFTKEQIKEEYIPDSLKGGGVMYVTLTDNMDENVISPQVTDKSFNEILDALKNGMVVYLYYSNGFMYLNEFGDDYIRFIRPTVYGLESADISDGYASVTLENWIVE